MRTEKEIIEEIKSLYDPSNHAPFVKGMASFSREIQELDMFDDTPLKAIGGLLENWMSGLENRLQGNSLSRQEMIAMQQYKRILGAVKKDAENEVEQDQAVVFDDLHPVDKALLHIRLKKQGKDVNDATLYHEEARVRMENVRTISENRRVITVYEQVDRLMQELGKVNPSLGIPMDTPELPAH